MKNTDRMQKALWAAAALDALVLLFVGWVYTEVVWGIALLALVLVGILSALAYLNQQSLRAAAGTRSARYGANALVSTLLVVGILVTLNFLNFNHYWKKDLTKAGTHTLSEQTIKLLKDLKEEVKATAYVKAQGREQMNAIFRDYQYYTKKLTVEFIDPDRDPARAKAANIKKYGTVVLTQGAKEGRVDDPNEEKLTNALIKLAQTKTQTMCFLTGHGEKSPESNDAEGYASVKKEMAQSAWETRTLSLLEEGKVPEVCSVVLILGPTKAFFDKELAVLKEWLAGGGRALVALDADLQRGSDRNGQMNGLLADWGVKVRKDIVIDPLSKLLGAEANVPVVATWSKENVITKDFQATALFPLASSIETSATPPSGVKITWLGKSTPKSFTETDFKELAKGRAQFQQGPDTMGPLDLLVAVDGKQKDSKAARNTRIVVMGTSNLATNNYSRFGQNIDVFLNSVSWLADDESLISIRAKEEGTQAVTLSNTEARYVQLLSVVLVPLFTLGTGLVTYVRRRRL